MCVMADQINRMKYKGIAGRNTFDHMANLKGFPCYQCMYDEIGNPQGSQQIDKQVSVTTEPIYKFRLGRRT